LALVEPFSRQRGADPTCRIQEQDPPIQLLDWLHAVGGPNDCVVLVAHLVSSGPRLKPAKQRCEDFADGMCTSHCRACGWLARYVPPGLHPLSFSAAIYDSQSPSLATTYPGSSWVAPSQPSAPVS